MPTIRILVVLLAVLTASCSAASEPTSTPPLPTAQSTTTTVPTTTTTLGLVDEMLASDAEVQEFTVDDDLLFGVDLRLRFAEEEDSPLDFFFDSFDDQAEADDLLKDLGLGYCLLLTSAKADGEDAYDTIVDLANEMSDNNGLYRIEVAVTMSAVDYLCPSVKEWFDEGVLRYLAEDG